MSVPEIQPLLSPAPVSRDRAAKRRYTLAFLLLATAAALYVCYLMARPFLKPILLAAVMAIVFYPLHTRIEKRVRGPNLAALVSMLLVLVIVLIPLVGLGGTVTDEIRQVYLSLSVKSAAGGGWIPYATLELQKPLDLVGRHINLSGFNPRAAIRGRLEQLSAGMVRAAADVVTNLGSFLLDAAISFFTLFFLFREGRRVRRTIAAVLPLEAAQVERLFLSISETIVANVYGVLAVALVQGLLMALVFLVLRIGSPILWGMMTAACSLVPVVGTALVWIPAAIYLFAAGHWVRALILLGWGAGFVGLVDHAARLYVIGGRVKMNTLLIFFSLLGGIEAFGILGIIVGPLVLSITLALLGILREEARAGQVGWAREEAAPPPGPLA